MSKAKWKNFTLAQIQEFVEQSRSFRQLAQFLGYSPDGGSSIATVRKMTEELQLDTSHFTGMAWNKNNFDYERFQDGKAMKPDHALRALTQLRGHNCERCKLAEWQGVIIPLEVHHKDGDHLNNELENLELLCPNCHALTENWRGKNVSKKERVEISEEEFVHALQNSPNIRQALIKLGLTPAGGNYTRANEFIIKYQIQHLLK